MNESLTDQAQARIALYLTQIKKHKSICLTDGEGEACCYLKQLEDKLHQVKNDISFLHISPSVDDFHQEVALRSLIAEVKQDFYQTMQTLGV